MRRRRTETAARCRPQPAQAHSADPPESVPATPCGYRQRPLYAASWNLVRAACPPRSVDRAYALAIATETTVATTGNTNANAIHG